MAVEEMVITIMLMVMVRMMMMMMTMTMLMSVMMMTTTMMISVVEEVMAAMLCTNKIAFLNVWLMSSDKHSWTLVKNMYM